MSTIFLVPAIRKSPESYGISLTIPATSAGISKFQFGTARIKAPRRIKPGTDATIVAVISCDRATHEIKEAASSRNISTKSFENLRTKLQAPGCDVEHPVKTLPITDKPQVVSWHLRPRTRGNHIFTVTVHFDDGGASSLDPAIMTYGSRIYEDHGLSTTISTNAAWAWLPIVGTILVAWWIRRRYIRSLGYTTSAKL